MLFRLQRLGVDVANRWEELADKAEARIGDCASAFTLPHWVMALTATGRTAVAERMIAAMRAFANGRGTVPPIVRDYVQLFLDTALKAGSTTDIRLALERVAGRRAIPPERFIGWRDAANRAAVGAL